MDDPKVTRETIKAVLLNPEPPAGGWMPDRDVPPATLTLDMFSDDARRRLCALHRDQTLELLRIFGVPPHLWRR